MSRPRRCVVLGVIVCSLLSAGFVASSSWSIEITDFLFVEGRFDNPTYLVKPSQGLVMGTNACSFFSGNYGPKQAPGWDPASQVIPFPPGTPNDGTNYLLQSSIGWPTPATLGWVDPTGTVKSAYDFHLDDGNSYVKKVKQAVDLYYSNASGNPEDIYFNYDFNFADDAQLFPDTTLVTELASAKQALYSYYMAWLLNQSINNTAIDGLLDVIFQLGTAFIMKGNLELEKAFSVRFLEEFRKFSPGEEINDELTYLGWDTVNDQFHQSKGAYYFFNEASKLYLDLFGNSFTRRWLIDRARGRDFVQDGPAFPEPVTVYDGYKDIMVMMRALAQRARATNEVAKRLVRLPGKNRTLAATIIETNTAAIALEEGLISSVFFQDGLPQDLPNTYPSLNDSLLAYRTGMEEMVRTHQAALNDRMNALGFDRDVLLIVPGSNTAKLWTYDWLIGELLTDEGLAAPGVLKASVEADEVAKSKRKAFETKASEYLFQFDQITNEYNTQLVSICGSDPNDVTLPNLDDPLHGGGLLEEQAGNVEMAHNRITRVLVEMSNVHAKIDIERRRVYEVIEKFNRKAELTIKIGKETAQLTKEIADIQADMAAASSSANAIASLGKTASGDLTGVAGFLAHGANASYQKDQMHRIGLKQAKIVRLQAEKEAQFIYLDNEIADINSAAQIQTWFLDLRTLEIDLLDAEILLATELDRLARYYTQIDEKIARRDRAEKRLATRSLADPTYRIEVLDSALEAEDKFQTAQVWVYLTARALEYKWPIDQTDLNNNTIPKIVMARTSKMLVEYLGELKQSNFTSTQGYGFQPFYWNFSLRKDYLGMTFDKEIPNSGGQVQTPVEQFQQHLTNLKSRSEYLVKIDGKDHLAIPFSTVKFNIPHDITDTRTLPDSEGNKQATSARPVFDPGLWDDKIDWVQVNFIGDNIYTDPNTMPIHLWYGGSGFVRYLSPLPLGPEKELVDFRTVPVPHYTLSKAERGVKWEGQPYLKQAFTAKLTSDPRDIPLETFQNKNFREHPVAATDWRLLIPLAGTSLENIYDIEVIIVHRARTRL